MKVAITSLILTLFNVCVCVCVCVFDRITWLLPTGDVLRGVQRRSRVRRAAQGHLNVIGTFWGQTSRSRSSQCHLGSDEPLKVISMSSARYGRMRQDGRCVKRDYGYVGCAADVLAHVDRLCSGRRVCDFAVAELHGSQPCPNDLTPYLEASYECLPGIINPYQRRSGHYSVRPLMSSDNSSSILYIIEELSVRLCVALNQCSNIA